MSKKDNKKTNKIIGNKKIIILATLLFVFLLVVGIIITINYVNVKEEKEKINNRKDYENAIEEVKNEFYEQGEIVPNRYNMFERMYEGNVDTSKVYPDIYNLVEIVIPDIQKRFKGKSNNEIENFYKDNKERIEQSLGIVNKDDYIKFVNYIKDLELGTYKDSSFDEINYRELEKADQIPLEIVYTKQTIKIYMEIDREETDNNPISFKAI